MKNAIRMYHLFFPRKWVVYCVYILYPFLGFAVGSSMWFFPEYVRSITSLVFTLLLMVSMEYILDLFMLSGIAMKNNRSLEYIKTSAKGVQIFSRGVVVDAVRRILSAILIVFGLYLAEIIMFSSATNPDEEFRPSLLLYIECGVLTLLLTEIGLCLIRRTKNVLLSFWVVWLMTSLSSSLSLAVYGAESFGVTLILGIAMVVIMIFSRKYLIKKVRESYYDEGYKEVF